METLTARDVMSGPVLSVRADLTLKEVSTRLSEAGISGAPVVDDAGSLLGVVSQADLARTLGEGGGAAGGPELTVRRIMTPVADTVSEDATVPEIARIMVANQYHRLVVTRREEPVGIVSSMDLLKLIAELY